ncbi:hypothetical protein XENOCAPTIV_013399 [Xenoophorus captivus]|uniref:Uncharacterized protein n=1 Tax=Xenoophorus captivus TaxID=1517983 RepID=A0ABV0RRZ1_9TELE
MTTAITAEGGVGALKGQWTTELSGSALMFPKSSVESVSSSISPITALEQRHEEQSSTTRVSDRALLQICTLTFYGTDFLTKSAWLQSFFFFFYPGCNMFCEVHQSLLQQSNIILPSCASQLGRC